MCRLKMCEGFHITPELEQGLGSFVLHTSGLGSRSRSVQMCHDAKCGGHISHLCSLHSHSSRAAKSPVHKLVTKDDICCQV